MVNLALSKGNAQFLSNMTVKVSGDSFRAQQARGELQATDIEKRFYTHEIRELERYRNLGIKDGEVPQSIQEQKAVWNNTHAATLEDYKVNEKTQPLYTPEAEEAYRKAEEGK